VKESNLQNVTSYRVCMCTYSIYTHDKYCLVDRSKYIIRICVYVFLSFVDRASLYNLFQMKPTMCTLLLNIFISTNLHVSGNYVPIVRRTYCICATLVFFTLYGWLSGLQTRQHTVARNM